MIYARVKGGPSGSWARVQAIQRFFYGRHVLSAMDRVVGDGAMVEVQKEVSVLTGAAVVVIRGSVVGGVWRSGRIVLCL